MSTTHDVAPGTVLDGRFQLEAELGAGGMGRVWRAHDQLLDRPVAIKLLRSGLGDEAAQRIEREAQATARVRDPRIVTVLDFRRPDDGPAYLVLEVYGGRTLADELRSVPLPAGRFDRLVHDLVGGLAAAHAAGVVHQDVKPSNVLVAGDGYRVSDFGVASFEDETDAERAFFGTPAYIAPERLTGAPPSTQADVYSLGAVLREAMPDGTDPSVSAAVDRALDTDPARRPRDAGALLGLLVPSDETVLLATADPTDATDTIPLPRPDGGATMPLTSPIAPPSTAGPTPSPRPEPTAVAAGPSIPEPALRLQAPPPHRTRIRSDRRIGGVPAPVVWAIGAALAVVVVVAIVLGRASSEPADGPLPPDLAEPRSDSSTTAPAPESLDDILERIAEVGS